MLYGLLALYHDANGAYKSILPWFFASCGVRMPDSIFDDLCLQYTKQAPENIPSNFFPDKEIENSYNIVVTKPFTIGGQPNPLINVSLKRYVGFDMHPLHEYSFRLFLLFKDNLACLCSGPYDLTVSVIKELDQFGIIAPSTFETLCRTSQLPETTVANFRSIFETAHTQEIVDCYKGADQILVKEAVEGRTAPGSWAEEPSGALMNADPPAEKSDDEMEIVEKEH
jgi:hypothetical protein